MVARRKSKPSCTKTPTDFASFLSSFSVRRRYGLDGRVLDVLVSSSPPILYAQLIYPFFSTLESAHQRDIEQASGKQAEQSRSQIRPIKLKPIQAIDRITMTMDAVRVALMTTTISTMNAACETALLTVQTNDNGQQTSVDATTSKAAASDDITCASSVVSSLPPVEELATNDGDGSSVASSVTDPMCTPIQNNVSTRGGVFSASRRNGFVQWKSGDKLYSGLIRDGLQYKAAINGKPEDADIDNVVMLFESPSTASKDTSFYNNQVFPIHDYPPSDPANKTVLAPLRYSMMNGSDYPSYLRDAPPEGLMQHWRSVLPEIDPPKFVSEIAADDRVYAYLPLEHIRNHVNDPHVHYHIAGKDALYLMTPNTPRRLANTKDVRPCIAKVTHSMASKGIFVINNDDDEQELFDFLASSGRPNFVVTEFVDIARNVSCHFFIHPSGEIIWFGSSENYKLLDGRWGMDAMIVMDEQEELRDMQLPYAREVADYCLSLGFWGFCGIDVLFDAQGQGHIVDVNPRTTGTCPALMASRVLEAKYGYSTGVFRRSCRYPYPGSAEELLSAVEAYNTANAGTCTIVLASIFESSPTKTFLNIGVYGHDLAHCRAEMDLFAQPPPPTD